MSIGSRIKELRESKNISRTELAGMIGVTVGAISNYENDVSSPKEPILFKIIESLDCDANYLFQDMVKIKGQKNDVTLTEYNMVKKYRNLDSHGKEMVDFTLQKEWERSVAENRISDNVISIAADRPNNTVVNAAHADDYINAPEALRQQEENIMDDENF